MKPELIDTHAHLNLAAFQNDGDQIFNRCFQEKIGVINVGTNYQTSLKAVELSKTYDENVWAAIGLHPIHLYPAESDPWEFNESEGSSVAEEDFSSQRYEDLLKRSPKVVAIGEIGLDYWRLPKDKEKIPSYKEKQKEGLQTQLDFALAHDRPVIIHVREAFSDLIEIFKKRKGDHLRGVIHCFTGSWDEAKFFLDFGFYLGFDGVIFKTDIDETIAKIPKNRMLIETDCPYLTPPQKKGERNTPLNLRFIVDKLAQVRRSNFQEIARITTQNAKELFQL